MHVTNLGYLKDELFCFIKLSNSNMEELNKILGEMDNIAAISDNDNKYSPNLLDLKVKYAKKKKEKAQKCQ